ncbi:unnamed protein product [Ectocarpus sp. 12 AP-2014]
MPQMVIYMTALTSPTAASSRSWPNKNNPDYCTGIKITQTIVQAYSVVIEGHTMFADPNARRFFIVDKNGNYLPVVLTTVTSINRAMKERAFYAPAAPLQQLGQSLGANQEYRSTTPRVFRCWRTYAATRHDTAIANNILQHCRPVNRRQIIGRTYTQPAVINSQPQVWGPVFSPDPILPVAILHL